MKTLFCRTSALTNDQRTWKKPDFSRLGAWDALRARFLGLGPDPLDRAGRGFGHG